MGLFDFYWILLIVSGIIMIGLGASGFGRATKGVRAVNLIFGAGFVGYGLYLGLFFTGDSYFVFFQAFVVPVVLVVNAVRSRASQPKAPAMGQQPPTWPPAPGQPQNQVPTTPWIVPNQQAPGQPSPNQQIPNQPSPNQAAATPPPYSAPASLTTPTLTSDDVLGR